MSDSRLDDPDKLIRIAENLRTAKSLATQRMAAKPVPLSLFPEHDEEAS